MVYWRVLCLHRYFPASSLPQSLPVTRDAIRIYLLSSVADLSRIRVSEEARSGQLLHQHAAAIEYQETELAFYTMEWEDNKRDL